MDFVARWTLRAGVAVGATAPLIGSLLDRGGGGVRLQLFVDCPLLREYPGIGLTGWGVAWVLAALATVPEIRERDELSRATVAGLGIWSAFCVLSVLSPRCPPVILAVGVLGVLLCAGLSIAFQDLEAVASRCRLAWAGMLLILAASGIEVVRLSRTPVAVGLLAIGGLGLGIGELLALRRPRAAPPALFRPPPRA
jgi:hypothetical protein